MIGKYAIIVPRTCHAPRLFVTHGQKRQAPFIYEETPARIIGIERSANWQVEVASGLPGGPEIDPDRTGDPIAVNPPEDRLVETETEKIVD